MPGPSWVKYIPGNGYSYGARTTGLTADELHFCENHARAETIAESNDPQADYSYDDWALCTLDGEYYAFNTSGCSCPSPDETWGLEFRGTREQLVEWLGRDLKGTGQWINLSAFGAFLRACEAAGIELKEPAPVEGQRYDW